jgi:hypothetical protein
MKVTQWRYNAFSFRGELRMSEIFDPRRYRIVAPVNVWIRIGRARADRSCGRGAMHSIYLPASLLRGDELVECWRQAFVVFAEGMERWPVQFETPFDRDEGIRNRPTFGKSVPDGIRQYCLRPLSGGACLQVEERIFAEQDRHPVQASRVVRLDPDVEGNQARMFRSPVMAIQYLAGTFLGVRLAGQFRPDAANHTQKQWLAAS